MSENVCLIVPCFNEAQRWRTAYWVQISSCDKIKLLFVDDGSCDATPARIAETRNLTQSQLIQLSPNKGKGEAIRIGMSVALNEGFPVVGYLDADGAFPSDEVIRLVTLADQMLCVVDGLRADSIWSSRVMLAGRELRRKPYRHYVGRSIATVLAGWHGHEVYDTQSGFKLFKGSAVLQACLREPFQTRWFSEIELLQRWWNLTGHKMRVWEEPILGWRDVPDSKINVRQVPQLVLDLARLFRNRV